LLDGSPRADWSELTPVLSDFGIALDGDAAADLSVSGSIGLRGTPAFMAPEQVAGLRKSIGPPADVFALGATLYALLTGRPPFQAASPIETIDLIRSRDPAAPRDLVRGLPRDLETICLHALRKDPGRRYESAEALAEDLRRWLDGFPILARPVSNLGQAARWCQRHPVPATLTGLLGATVLASLIGLTALWQRAEDQHDQARLALDRALESEAAADLAVGDLLRLVESRMDSPHQRFSDRVDEVIPVLLDLTMQLRRNPRLSASHAVSISQLELRVSDLLRGGGQYDRIFPIMEDSTDLLRSALERNPLNRDLAIAYTNVRIYLDLMRSEFGRQDSPIEDFRHLVSILEPFVRDARTLPSLARLQEYGIILAARSVEQGRPEVARSLREEASDSFGRFRQLRPDDWSICLLDDLAKTAEAAQGPTAPTALVVSSLRQAPKTLDIPEGVASIIGSMIANQLCEEQTTGKALRLDPEIVASSLLKALDERLDGLEPDRGLRFEIMDQVARLGSVQATRCRRAGRVEDTRWVIGWMFALGRALERREPDNPGAHILISRAFEQEHKLAWHLDDRDVLEPTLLGALTEGTKALALVPQSTLTREHVAALREKYIRLVTQEPDPTAADPAPGPSGRQSASQANPILGDVEPSP
jgi:hypothetical protein